MTAQPQLLRSPDRPVFPRPWPWRIRIMFPEGWLIWRGDRWHVLTRDPDPERAVALARAEYGFPPPEAGAGPTDPYVAVEAIGTRYAVVQAHESADGWWVAAEAAVPLRGQAGPLWVPMAPPSAALDVAVHAAARFYAVPTTWITPEEEARCRECGTLRYLSDPDCCPPEAP